MTLIRKALGRFRMLSTKSNKVSMVPVPDDRYLRISILTKIKAASSEDEGGGRNGDQYRSPSAGLGVRILLHALFRR